MSHAHRRQVLRKQAFTLTETLVAIGVIALLAAISLGALSGARVRAWSSQCASNQRQIGMALQLYTHDHDGEYPQTTHSTGFRRELSWIYTLSDYLENIDEIRVCPAEPALRQKQIIENRGSSYVLNDLVFDNHAHNAPAKLPNPSQTLLLCILSESRPVITTRDHIHGGEWTSWWAALSDIEPDRHRHRARAPDRTQGSSNYLYADGRVENIDAIAFKKLFDRGINPAQPQNQ